MIQAPELGPPPLQLGEEWRRLHPLSPLVRVGAGLAAVLVFFATSLGRPTSPGTSSFPILLWLATAAIGLIFGVVSWIVTRWRIHGGDLQIEMGLIRRQSFRVPLARIQAVDVVAPLTARLLGLAEVRVVSAGRGLERGRLAYVSAAEAPMLRAQLLALAHGLDAETPEPQAQQLLAVANVRLGVGLVLRPHLLVPMALVVVLAVTGLGVSAHTADIVGVDFGLALVLIALATIGRAFNDDYAFTISEAGDGVRLDRGLLQRRHETIPYGRIQAIRWVQPLLWRPFGWCRLEVDVARQHVARHGDRDAKQVARRLMPIASVDEAAWLISRVMPGVRAVPPLAAMCPPRARLKAPFSYHFLAAWYDDRYMCARTGRFQAATVMVPLDKIQSVRRERGPVQRWLRLATVHIDTAGHRWQASARCRDDGEADSLMWTMAELSRHARLREPVVAHSA